MGTPWAPSYACLHLGLWEDEVVYRSQLYLSHSNMWLRYIDDILMIWGGTIQQLFIDELNNNRNFRLTFSPHHETLPFLDVNIGVCGDQTVTKKNYRKETAANALITHTSIL